MPLYCILLIVSFSRINNFHRSEVKIWIFYHCLSQNPCLFYIRCSLFPCISYFFSSLLLSPLFSVPTLSLYSSFSVLYSGFSVPTFPARVSASDCVSSFTTPLCPWFPLFPPLPLLCLLCWFFFSCFQIDFMNQLSILSLLSLFFSSPTLHQLGYVIDPFVLVSPLLFALLSDFRSPYFLSWLRGSSMRLSPLLCFCSPYCLSLPTFAASWLRK